MTDSMKDQFATDLEKAKAEGGTRANRIREIVKAAAVETMAEVKAGSKELGSIAQNRFSNIATNLKPTPETASFETPADANIPSDPAASAEPQQTGQANQTEQQILRFKTLLLNLLQGLRQSLSGVDAKLNEQYGDRYSTAKRQLEQSADWYSQKLEAAKSQPSQPALLEQKQDELAERAAVAGVAVAQKEEQIKQQLKTIVQTLIAK